MKTFMRLLPFLKPFRWSIALAILLGCVTVASNVALLSMAAYLIAAATLGPLLVLLTIPIYVVRFMGVVRAGSRYFERLCSHHVTFRLLAKLRIWSYERLEPLAPAHLLTFRSGDMLARLVSDIEELQNVYLRVVYPIIVAVLISLLTFGLFLIFSPLLAWTALAFLVATGVALPWLSERLARGLGRRQLALRATLQAHIVDGIQGVQDLLAYGAENDQRRKIADLNSELATIQRRMSFISALQQALNDLCMNIALWVILLLAIPLVISKDINGVYLAFLALAILGSFEAIQPLAQAFQMLGHSLAAGERVFAIVDAVPSVKDPADPVPVPKRASYDLTFEHVHFAYTEADGEILHDISFAVPAGKRVALVGPSGSGKSTLARLALRFWNPTKGEIQLAGLDLGRIALDDLRALISVVDQDTYLFNNTLRNNLLLARPEASEEELLRVMEQARLSEFLAALPDGLDTWIGEQGLRLSGGERQRLAVARALLKDTPLLFLDEATANLDPLTERALLDTLDPVMHGRTTLLITHRLIAMERMDEILVLEKGRIVERGTHEELLRAEGLYQRLYAVQNELVTLM